MDESRWVVALASGCFWSRLCRSTLREESREPNSSRFVGRDNKRNFILDVLQTEGEVKKRFFNVFGQKDQFAIVNIFMYKLHHSLTKNPENIMT